MHELNGKLVALTTEWLHTLAGCRQTEETVVMGALLWH